MGRAFVAGCQSLVLPRLAEALAAVLQQASPSLSEQQAEDIGIFMARHRELFAKAFKSSPEALAELSSQA